MKTVLLIIAFKDFQPIECQETRRVLEKAKIKVKIASNEKGLAEGAGITEKVDLSLEEVAPENFDGIFLIGGPGAMEQLDNKKTYKIMRAAKDLGKVFGAICIAPRILAKAGLLSGKKATGWNGDGNLDGIFHSAKADYTCERVEADGNLITADGPASAAEFGEKIKEVLGG